MGDTILLLVSGHSWSLMTSLSDNHVPWGTATRGEISGTCSRGEVSNRPRWNNVPVFGFLSCTQIQISTGSVSSNFSTTVNSRDFSTELHPSLHFLTNPTSVLQTPYTFRVPFSLLIKITANMYPHCYHTCSELPV